MSLDNWRVVANQAAAATSRFSYLYFVAFVIIGNFFFMNLFIGAGLASCIACTATLVNPTASCILLALHTSAYPITRDGLTTLTHTRKLLLLSFSLSSDLSPFQLPPQQG